MAGRADPCAGFVYRIRVGDCLVCDYISIVGHRRPCPFGAGCVVKETEDGMKRWDKARAYELYQAGASDREIAEEVGVETGTIYRWRREKGLTAHRPAAQVPPADTGPGPEPPESETAKPTDRSGPEEAGGDWPQGPVELHLELAGGWVRLRAPDWRTGRTLCDMMGALMDRVGAMGWPNE